MQLSGWQGAIGGEGGHTWDTPSQPWLSLRQPTEFEARVYDPHHLRYVGVHVVSERAHLRAIRPHRRNLSAAIVVLPDGVRPVCPSVRSSREECNLDGIVEAVHSSPKLDPGPYPDVDLDPCPIPDPATKGTCTG